MARYLLILAAVILAVPGLLSSCAPAAKTDVTLSYTCDEFSSAKSIEKSIDATVGNKITVNLCSNRTTGYSWPEKAQISDPQVVEQTSYKWVPPESTGAVGVAGTEVYTFKVLQPGTSTIYLEYSRSWQGGEKGTWTFKLNVNAH